MKGGVTSGVVYPGAIIELGRRYRFRNIGGTSAGAIGAAVAAAAEYRRQCHRGTSFADSLSRLVDDLVGQGALVKLLQPTKETRPLMRILLASVQDGRRPTRRFLTMARLLLLSRWWLTAAVSVIAAGVAVATVDADGLSGALTGALVAAVLLSAAVGAIGGSALLLARSVKRSLDKPQNGFGMCSGLSAPGCPPALTEWLHESIERIAGPSRSTPLTFSDLKQRDINLVMVATDLSSGRPVRLPLAPGDSRFRYDPCELGRLFPKPVLDHLKAHSGEADDAGLRCLPADDLPVVVGVRMSLGFPVLLSAIPLHAADAPGKPASRSQPTWISDGGITSNFPVHLFDAWLPERPTFGLDLRPHAEPLAVVRRPGDPDAGRPTLSGPGDHPPSRWGDVRGIGMFLRQVGDAALNWRDSALADLPGYHDRICRIPLAASEGGLNLNMSAETVENLIERGRIAGQTLADAFAEKDRWPRHLTTRYLAIMSLLQDNVATLKPSFEGAQETLGGVPEVDERSLGRARRATRALIFVVGRWRQPPHRVDFTRDFPALEPPSDLRVAPRE